MSNNKNIFNGNTDTNIIGDNNRVEKNTTQNNHNHFHGNNGSSNSDSNPAIYILSIGFILVIVIFIYTVYFPYILLMLKILTIILLFISLYGLWRDRQQNLTNLLPFGSAITSFFYLLPRLSDHFYSLKLNPYSEEINRKILYMAWDFYKKLPENIKISLACNIFITIIFIFSSFIFTYAIFKNDKTKQVIGFMVYLIIPCIFYFPI